MSTVFSCSTCDREFKSARSLQSHKNWHDPEYAKASSHKNVPLDLRVRQTIVQTRSDTYMLSPIRCKYCNISLNYQKRRNKFCSLSCSTKNSNQNRSDASRDKQRTSLNLTLSKKPKQTRAKRLYNLICKVCNTNFIHTGKIKTCSVECRSEIYSKTAKNNKMLGGNKNNRAHGYYHSVFAGKVWLDSSYELTVAIELDFYGIRWIRPAPFIWIDPQGKTRRYFPDFYLTDYNVYLDPKNDYLITKDNYKINEVIRIHDIRVLILNSSELTWDRILPIINRSTN